VLQGRGASPSVRSENVTLGAARKAQYPDAGAARRRPDATRLSEDRGPATPATGTRGRGELAMTSGGHRMAPNPHVVGGIEEGDIGTRSAADDSLHKLGIAAGATSHPMLAGVDRMTSISPVEMPVRVRSISTSIEASSPSPLCEISKSQHALSTILLSAIRSARLCASDRLDRKIVGTSASPMARAA
jgi:hypothetical protein